LGTCVSVDAPEPVRTELRAVLTDLESASDPRRQLVVEEEGDFRFRLLDSGEMVREGIEPSVAAATVVWRLNAIAADTRRYLLIHAGCVADERAVLLPGRSGAGKSTLAAECVVAGMAYLSDEYAAIDLQTGVTVPYAKPLALERERLVASSHLRAGSVGSPVSPAGIAFPCYSPGASLSVTPLDPGSTLLALAAHTTNLANLGGTALRWLAGVATACPSWQISYGDAADAVPTVRNVGRTRPSSIRPADVIGPVTPTTTSVVLGDDLAVFDDPTGRVHLLNAGAAFVWACVPDAPDGPGLADVALARAPAGSLDRPSISATVEHLAVSGLLPDRLLPAGHIPGRSWPPVTPRDA